MIVGGTSNSGKGLGKYLTTAENAQAEVWELNSARRDLGKAIDDWKAYAHGTKAEKPLYHAWLRPSDTDRPLSREDWDKAIAIFEKEMGFEGQPRAVIYHHGEGQGEQGHIHLVYSRIKDGKAITDKWNYIRHEKARVKIEQELNLEHVYSPHLDRDEPRRAQGFNRDEIEQGKRNKIPAETVKAEVSELYQCADSGRAFVAALGEAGYTLAWGESRAYVIVDKMGGPHSLSRMLNGTAKAKEWKERLKDYPPESLPKAEDIQKQHEAARKQQQETPDRGGRERDRVLETTIPAPEADRQKGLNETAGNIRLAYALTDTPQDFAAALEERGLILARVSAEEAQQSERRRDFAKELGQFAPAYREGETVVINQQGQLYRLDARTTGDSRADIEKYLGTLDHAALPSVEFVRDMQRHHAAAEVENILKEISRTRAVFDERDITQAIHKHEIIPEARDMILTHERIIKLTGEDGKTLFTTADTRANEQDTLELARRLQGKDKIPAAGLENTLRRYEEAGRPLDAEQENALRQSLDNRLSVIQGRAGTGKSFTLNALRETLEGEGYQVTGLAPTNTAAKDLREAGFQDARTLHSFLYAHQKANEEGRPLDNRARVLIVDEAAMIDTRRTQELLQAADQLKARVVFAGDERQLASIEAGGMFGVFAKEFGEAELSTVHRQREDWQKDASRAFARGDTAEGMQAYADHGAIQWSDKREDAAAHLVQEWVKQRDKDPGKSAFVFAHTNADADSLNTALQAEQIKAGRVSNLQAFATERGKISVGEGDRLQFRANDKPNGVYNGSLGTVEKIDGETLTVRLDTGSEYNLDSNTYKDFQLGYAGTVYRGQGKTIDNAFVLYSSGMDKKSAYVAMTRARDDTNVFAAREDAADLDAIVENIDSRQHYGASLNYEAKEESRDLPPPAPVEAEAEAERQRPAPEMGETAADIRLAYQHSDSGKSFAAALEDKGIILARVSAEEAEQSQRAADLAKDAGRFAQAHEEGDLVAVDDKGRAHRIDTRTTGDSGSEIEKFCATVDRAELLTVTEAREAMKDAARARLAEQRQAEREATPTEQAIQTAFENSTDRAGFLEQLDAHDLILAQADAASIQNLKTDYENQLAFATSNRTLNTARAASAELTGQKTTEADLAPELWPDPVPALSEGELVAVNRYGDTLRLNPHTLNLPDIEARLSEAGKKPPSLDEARQQRHEINALHSEWEQSRADQREAARAARIAAWEEHAAADSGHTPPAPASALAPVVSEGLAVVASLAEAGLEMMEDALGFAEGIIEGFLDFGSPPPAPPTKQEIQKRQAIAEARTDDRAARIAAAEAFFKQRDEEQRQRRERDKEEERGRGRWRERDRER